MSPGSLIKLTTYLCFMAPINCSLIIYDLQEIATIWCWPYQTVDIFIRVYHWLYCSITHGLSKGNKTNNKKEYKNRLQKMLPSGSCVLLISWTGISGSLSISTSASLISSLFDPPVTIKHTFLLTYAKKTQLLSNKPRNFILLSSLFYPTQL